MGRKKKRIKKIRKYLVSLGWSRHKEHETEDSYCYFFEHPKHGEYQLQFDKNGYLFTDDSDELEYDDEMLTNKLVDYLHTEFIDKNIKSYKN